MDLNKLAELLRYDQYEEIDLALLASEPSSSRKWTEGFVPRPGTCMQYFANARLISSAIVDGLSQKAVAAELGISAQEVTPNKRSRGAGPRKL